LLRVSISGAAKVIILITHEERVGYSTIGAYPLPPDSLLRSGRQAGASSYW